MQVRCCAGEVDVGVVSRAATAQSLKLGVAGQPRTSPVQVPAYLHTVARPGATPNTKVGLQQMSCSVLSNVQMRPQAGRDWLIKKINLHTREGLFIQGNIYMSE